MRQLITLAVVTQSQGFLPHASSNLSPAVKDEDSLLDVPEDRDSDGDSDEVRTLPRRLSTTILKTSELNCGSSVIHNLNCAAQLFIMFYFLNLLPVFLHAASCHFYFD